MSSNWGLLIKSVKRQESRNKPKSKKTKASQSQSYKKPEKLVEKDCIDWAKKNSVFLHVVEAKAVFSQAAGRYLSGQVESGFPDLVGNNTDGKVVWIELKAKDRRSTLSPVQYKFLTEKINQGCFAVVVDSADRLHEYYYTWKSSKNPPGYLMSLIPVPKQLRDETVDPEFGF